MCELALLFSSLDCNCSVNGQCVNRSVGMVTSFIPSLSLSALPHISPWKVQEGCIMKWCKIAGSVPR